MPRGVYVRTIVYRRRPRWKVGIGREGRLRRGGDTLVEHLNRSGETSLVIEPPGRTAFFGGGKMKLRRYLIMPPVRQTNVGFWNGIEYDRRWILTRNSPTTSSSIAAATAIAAPLHDHFPIDVIRITYILRLTPHFDHILQGLTALFLIIEQHGFHEIVTIPIDGIVG